MQPSCSNSVEFDVQKHWVWRPKALGLTSKSIGFEAKKHGVCHPMALRLRLIPHAIISPAITWSAEEERLPKRKSECKYIQTRAHLIFFTINPNRSLGFLCVVRQREILMTDLGWSGTPLCITCSSKWHFSSILKNRERPPKGVISLFTNFMSQSRIGVYTFFRDKVSKYLWIKYIQCCFSNGGH